MKAVDRVMQSYGRCCASQGFFDTFYQIFLASSPSVREKFANTEMVGQKQLLRQGIMNLVLYARGMPDTKLRALGDSHARGGLDIRPELYALWLDSLLLAIAQHDKDLNEEGRAAWREVMSKGITVIQSMY